MRIAVAELNMESNGFLSRLADMDTFQAGYVWRGAQIVDHLRDTRTEHGGVLATLERAGAAPVPLLAAHAVPYGRLKGDVYGALCDEIVNRLAAAMPVDGVVLVTHGAMLAEGKDDPEGALLHRLRSAVGSRVPIAVTCDMHAHITPTMCRYADILVGYQTYPHEDTYETGARAAALLLRALRGEVRSALGAAKINMILPPINQQTAYGPNSLLWYAARQLEARGDALAVSLFACHSKLDVPDMGWAAVVITDGDPARAQNLATALCRQAWDLRAEFLADMLSPQEAVRRALAADRGPVVLVDAGDVPGAGAAGDSAAALRALLSEGAHQGHRLAFMTIVDPEAAAACHGAGVGAALTLDLGHKLDPSWGAPVRVQGTVRLLFDGRFTYTGGLFSGSTVSVGPAAVLQVGAIQILIVSRSFYEYDDVHFRAAGMDVRQAQIVVVKMLMNYKFTLNHLARYMLVMDTPGPSTPDLNRLAWRRVQRPTWPLDPDLMEPTLTCW